MILVLILQLILFSADVFAAHDEPSIRCVCSTTHCMDHGMKTCNTTGVCFSQYLDRKDGSHTEVRGCISSKTPLLCENRRPAVAEAPWPVLLCCDTNFCNRDVVPTPPPFKFLRDRKNNQHYTSPGSDFHPEEEKQGIHKESFDQGDLPDEDKKRLKNPLLIETREPQPTAQNTSNHSNGFPTIVSPIYVSVLVLGIASLIIIGIVAAIVLRRNNKFYAEQYGALRERNEEYFKQPLNTSSSRYDDAECFDIIVQNIATSCPQHQQAAQPTPLENSYHLERDVPKTYS